MRDKIFLQMTSTPLYEQITDYKCLINGNKPLVTLRSLETGEVKNIPNTSLPAVCFAIIEIMKLKKKSPFSWPFDHMNNVILSAEHWMGIGWKDYLFKKSRKKKKSPGSCLFFKMSLINHQGFLEFRDVMGRNFSCVLNVTWKSQTDRLTFSSFIRLIVSSSEKSSVFTSLPCRKSLLGKSNNRGQSLNISRKDRHVCKQPGSK